MLILRCVAHLLRLPVGTYNLFLVHPIALIGWPSRGATLWVRVIVVCLINFYILIFCYFIVLVFWICLLGFKTVNNLNRAQVFIMAEDRETYLSSSSPINVCKTRDRINFLTQSRLVCTNITANFLPDPYHSLSLDITVQGCRSWPDRRDNQLICVMYVWCSFPEVVLQIKN